MASKKKNLSVYTTSSLKCFEKTKQQLDFKIDFDFSILFTVWSQVSIFFFALCLSFKKSNFICLLKLTVVGAAAHAVHSFVKFLQRIGV